MWALSMDWRFALLMRRRVVSLGLVIVSRTRMSPRDKRGHVMAHRAATLPRYVGDEGALSELEWLFGSARGRFSLLERVAEDLK
jgi:hypothetical protein